MGRSGLMARFKFLIIKRKTLIIIIVIILALIIGMKILSYKPVFSPVVKNNSNYNTLQQEESQRQQLLSADKELEGELRIEINTYSKQLVLYKDGEIYKSYPVAVGKSTTKSPVGEWAIITKSKNWGGGFGSRWLGLNVPWGIYGIHGTNKPGSIGRAASHGCIRMHNQHVEELYELIPRKTRVKIIGQRKSIDVNHELTPGQTGLAVMQLQDNLKKYGFEPSYMDARYGPSTVKAVQKLETQFGLKCDGRADWNVIYLIDLPK